MSKVVIDPDTISGLESLEVSAATANAIKEADNVFSPIETKACLNCGNATAIDGDGTAVRDADEDLSDNSEFGQQFEKTTGMPISESIVLYKARTGNDLTPETVEKLFTDPEFAKKALMEDKSLHTVYRDILNTNIPTTEATAKKAGFTKLDVHQSVFHNPWYNPWMNLKYVGPDGHLEAVYDSEGEIVRDKKYKGTFNFFGPDQAGNHKAADVDPYIEWDVKPEWGL
jgi:hypothetical protein